MTSRPTSNGMPRRECSTARRCRACTSAPPHTLRMLPICPLRMPSSSVRRAPGPVTAPEPAAMFSCPILSARVMPASNRSVRPMLLPCVKLTWFRNPERIDTMTQPPSGSAADTDGAGVPAARARTAEAVATAALTKDSLFAQVARLVAAFWASRGRNQLLLLAAGLVAVIAAIAIMQIRLNAWNRPFYDALTRKDIPQFVSQLRVFAELAVILLVLNVSQVWLNQTSRVVLRQGLVHDLLNEWLKPMRAFRLSNAGSIGQNPDQRLHADAQHLTELMTDLGIGLLQ